MSRLSRLAAPVLLAFGLLATAALGQDVEGDPGGGTTGEPLYGYVATAFLGAAALFVLCKSSRR